tara:strand:- start:293 stop:445 length:153 start_codon:yes stop_codon:yes gene_type:complete
MTKDNQLESAKKKLRESYDNYYAHRNSRQIKLITSQNIEDDIRRRKKRCT